MPLFGWPEQPGLIFTERRHDLRRHAGEISFPGGPPDPGEALLESALREAEEEIGLDAGAVEVVGALPPIGTFVTSFKVLPSSAWSPSGAESRAQPGRGRDRVIFSLEVLREGFGMRRLVRRGVPIRTPTYTVEEHLIWGATARILGDFLERIEGQ